MTLTEWLLPEKANKKSTQSSAEDERFDGHPNRGPR